MKAFAVKIPMDGVIYAELELEPENAEHIVKIDGVTYKSYVNVYNHCSAQRFKDFSVKAYNSKNQYIGAGSSNWMTVVDGVLHDASYGCDDDTYDGEYIITSPLVSIPSICDNHVPVSIQKVIYEQFRRLIFEEFKIDKINKVPILCEAEDFEEINNLKAALGFRWDEKRGDFYPSSL